MPRVYHLAPAAMSPPSTGAAAEADFAALNRALKQRVEERHVNEQG